MTLSMKTFSIMTITILTLRRTAIWHNDIQHNGPNPATKLNIVFTVFTVMPSAVMLSVRMGSVMTPRQVF